MSAINLVFPHQLFEESPLVETGSTFYLIEEYLFFKYYNFHKQKIAFHRASMKFYESYLKNQGYEVVYVESMEEISDVRKLIPHLKSKGVGTIHIIDPCDDWLSKRLERQCLENDIELKEIDSPLFLNAENDLNKFFKPGKKSFFQTSWYKSERKKRGILVDDDQKPQGGRWTYDDENRKKFPKKSVPPAIHYPEPNSFITEAKEYVETHYTGNLGLLENYPLYPIDFDSSRKWEDAIVKGVSILHHSVLTPMLNVGLITPQFILDEVLKYADENDIPINNTEGFVRQVIGWREFIRGMYISKGVEERTRNFWNFKRRIPASFYDGTTGITPLDQTIKKVLQTGYCHHIERLMILGNFMLLCEFDPDEVYRWFMELFIDAYDWVMVPNVYGMSQFADGGLMATKPYISSSNYIMKMSDYPKGKWQQTWDALFWRFMDVHRDFFGQNPRLGMLLRTLDKMSDEKKAGIHEGAERFLKSLDD